MFCSQIMCHDDIKILSFKYDIVYSALHSVPHSKIMCCQRCGNNFVRMLLCIHGTCRPYLTAIRYLVEILDIITANMEKVTVTVL